MFDDASRSPATRVSTVVAALTSRMESGSLRPGDRLPSLREAARAFRVSKNTVVAAYERLVASSRVESRPGSGFVVSGRRPVPATPPGPASVDAVDSVWLLREQLERHYKVRVGDGRPPASWMEGSELGRHLRTARRGGRPLAESYDSPSGFLPLRQLLATTLAERAIAVDPDRILLTSGANHALDLIIRLLVVPGDAVLVDSPGYYPLFGKLRLAQARIVGVRRTPEGPDPVDLAEKAAVSGASLFFTQSLAQNPTGCSITLPLAYRVLQAAGQAGLRIVECDPFGDVMPPASPRLAALDGLERVTYVGTVAKTLSASLRFGYVAGEAALVAQLRDLKMVTTVNSSGFVERVVHDLVDGGHYRRHLRRLAARIEAATVAGREIAERLGLSLFGQPAGGYYLWCELPTGLDAETLSREAAKRDALVAPGSLFSIDEAAARSFTRLNVAYLAEPAAARALASLLPER